MKDMERLVYQYKGKSIFFYFFIFTLLLTTLNPLFAVDVNDLEVIPRYIFQQQNGFSPDIAINPVDNNPHILWVTNGDMYYTYRKSDGTWMPTEVIQDGGRFVNGVDEWDEPSNCAALTVDSNGLVHIVFAEDDGDVNYFTGHYGNWGVIDEIEESITSKIMLDMVESQGNIYVVYEEGAEDEIFLIPCVNNEWKSKINIVRGEYPALAKDDNGMVYFVTRNRESIRNAVFGYLQSGSTSMTLVQGATDAQYRMGAGPNLAVGNGHIYLPWCDVPGPEGPQKATMYCATATEPGTNWTTRLGSSTPLFYEDTATPHPRAAVYNDGTLLYMNGRRNEPRFMVWDGSSWSNTRSAPWTGGMMQVASNGVIVWAINSNNGEISVSGVRLPGAGTSNDLTVGETTNLDSQGFSGDIALNPVDGSVYNLWVNSRDLKFRKRSSNGTWSSTSTISSNGLEVYGKDQNDFPQKCSAIDIAADGTAHILFAEKNGSVYYLNGTPGDWSTPQQIDPKTGHTIYPSIIACNRYYYAAYHDVAQNNVKLVDYQNGEWGEPYIIGKGSHPQLYRGENGMVYLLYQEEETLKRNATFAWRIPGFTGWNIVENATNANDEVGDNPALAIGNGKIFLGWNNNTENSGDQKGHIFCAMADEPGLTWEPRLGTTEPLYYENTGDPHIATSVYSDGKVVLLNGRRQSPRFIEWDSNSWSGSKLAPWSGGTPRIVNDGKTAWVMVSPISSDASDVLLTGIVNPDAVQTDFNNGPPVISSMPDTIASANSQWTYSATATDDGVDPVTWELVTSPDGMTINSSTGLVTWTPGQSDMTSDPWNAGAGSHIVGIKVIDAQGRWGTQYFWLHIGGINYDPQITSQPETEAWVDTLYKYQVTATDQDQDDLTFSLSQKPSAMTINASTGLVQWTPQNGDEGDHSITVQVNDGNGGNAQQNYTITVTKIIYPPIPDFSTNVTSGYAPLTVQFTDESSGDITGWKWHFGDSDSSTQQNPEHTYSDAGAYTVKLTLTGPGGSAVLVRENLINVSTEQLVPQFTADTTNGLAPLTVHFTDQSTGNITSWEWDFGDNTTSTEQNPAHSYTQAGSFTVKLKITGPGGSESIVREDYINTYFEDLVPQFSADPDNGYAPLKVQFTDESTGSILDWKWDFGDNTTSTEQNPEHTYTAVGEYSVSLRITGVAGTSLIVKEKLVNVLPDAPTAAFSAQPVQGESPLTVAFTDASTGQIDSWLWDFGDGNSSMDQNPSHVYNLDGKYTVSLTVANAGGNNTKTMTDYITVQTSSSVESEGERVPTEFFMFNNYPNPFNAQTTISYQLPKATDVELIIYDINGQIVNVLYRGVQSEGSYRVIWNGTDYHGNACSTGMYIVHLQTNEHLSDKKIMLVK